MKHILITTIAAVLLVGCGESKESTPAPETQPAEPVAEAVKPESSPPTAKAPDVGIYWATLSGKIEDVRQHLADGVDVNAKIEGGGTPLHYAATAAQKEIAELLIAKGADVNARDDDGETPLDTAIQIRSTKLADLLRKHGGKRGDWFNADNSIHRAARAGHIEAVKKHLGDGTDVNAKNADGWTPLHEAARWGQKEIAELLIAKGADMNAKGEDGWTPLDWAITNIRGAHYKQTETIALLRKHGGKKSEWFKAEESIHIAAKIGHLEAVKQHLASGADVNAIDHEGNTLLHHAVYNDQTEIIRLLIDKGAEVNGKRKAANNEKGVAPLHTATWRSTIETMELLIDNGADVNMKRADGAIALHYAVWFGLKEKTEFLLSKGSDVKARDGNNEGATPLHVAVWKSPNNGIVELLIENEADVNDKNNTGETPLDWAIKFKRTELADLLRKHGGKTGKELEGGEPVVEAAQTEPPTAKAPDISIHDAIEKGNIEAVKQHLAAGADVNAKNKYGSTPLHRAIEAAHKEIAELLITNGADVNAKGEADATPLHYAATKEVAELLIVKGADVNAKDEFGETPLDLADGKSETAELLRKHGGKHGTINGAAGGGDIEAVKEFLAAAVDVNAKIEGGVTPLHYAAQLGHKEIVELLLANGKDVNAKSKYGRTPLDYAVKYKRTEIASLLRKHGGKTGVELKAKQK